MDCLQGAINYQCNAFTPMEGLRWVRRALASISSNVISNQARPYICTPPRVVVFNSLICNSEKKNTNAIFSTPENGSRAFFFTHITMCAHCAHAFSTRMDPWKTQKIIMPVGKDHLNYFPRRKGSPEFFSPWEGITFAVERDHLNFFPCRKGSCQLFFPVARHHLNFFPSTKLISTPPRSIVLPIEGTGDTCNFHSPQEGITRNFLPRAKMVTANF